MSSTDNAVRVFVEGGDRVFVQINEASLNVEVLGPDGAPVIIVHHGGGGIGSLAEPKASFGWLADAFRIVVYDARGCGISEGKPPYSHAQWAADLDGVRQWLDVDQVIVAGGSYGGFIAMEYAIAYPEHTRAMILRDTSPDSSNLELVFENARKQTRIDINWDNFERYWGGRIRDDEDLKACWAEIAPLYSYEDDRERAAARVENGSYRHETHNWCFQQNRPIYDVKPALPGVRCPTLITVGRHDWVTPVAMSETIAALIPDSQLVIFEKSGHSPPSDEPELFQRVVRDFLAKVAPEAFAGSRPQAPR